MILGSHQLSDDLEFYLQLQHSFVDPLLGWDCYHPHHHQKIWPTQIGFWKQIKELSAHGRNKSQELLKHIQKKSSD